MKTIIVTLSCLFGLMISLTVSSFVESIFPNDHGHSKVTRRDTQQTSNIPLNLISQLNNIENFDGLQNLINEESLKAAGIQFRDLNASISNRIGGSDGNAPVILASDNCKPRLQTIALSVSGMSVLETSHPACTRVERCGGCCTHELLSCQPTSSKQLYFEVIVTEYDLNSKQLKAKRKEVVTADQHLKCKCDCKIKKTDCSINHEYYKDKCNCLCRNQDDEKKCSQEKHKYWDSQSCKCLCNEPRKCSTDYFFSQETCRCEETKRRRRSDISANTTLE